MADYYYDDEDLMFVGTGTNDTLNFLDDSTGSFDWRNLSLVKDGNDLLAYGSNGQKVTLENHFLNDTSRIETISFPGNLQIDLTASNIIYTRLGHPASNLDYSLDPGTSGNDIMFVGIGQQAHEENIAYLATLSNPPSPQYSSINANAGDGDDTIFINYAWSIWAGNGNDTIYGRAVNMYGNDGDDTFYISEAVITPQAPTSMTAYGGEGDDVFYGSNIGDSNIFGDEGSDLLYGYGGDDSLRGGSGNDIIYGGQGNDLLLDDGYDFSDVLQQNITTPNATNTGDDYLYGGSGDDAVYVTNGIDIAYGEDGNDTITTRVGTTNGYLYGYGNKELYGGNGDDFITDGRDDDLLNGGDGNDELIAQHGGNNTLIGGAGNDTLRFSTSQPETNTVSGGADDDLYVFGSRGGNVLSYGTVYIDDNNGSDHYLYEVLRSSAYTLHDIGQTYIEDLNGANDSLELHSTSSTDWTFTSSGNDLVLTYTEHQPTSTIPYAGHMTITNFFLPFQQIENFIFEDITISIIETLTPNNDNYVASAATSPIGSDNNIVDALAGNDLIYTGIGNDIVYGQDGDDRIYGEAGNDYLFGDNGLDRLYGGLGNDNLRGGADTDRLYGNEGDDDLRGDAGNDFLYGHTGNDSLYGGSGNDTLYGFEDNDFISGGNDNDLIDGGDGDDELRGDHGVDRLYGQLGNDTLDGGFGIDYLYGGSGDDILIGGEGDDYLYAHDGADTLNGGAGIDRMYGGNGSDILIGGADADFLYGEASSDVFGFTSLDTADEISDFVLLGPAKDSINITDVLDGFDSSTDDINDFVSLVYKHSNRTDLFINQDGTGSDWVLGAVIKGSDLNGIDADFLTATNQLITDQSLL